MFYFLSLLALALAVSLDGFATAVTYGLRKIKIPLLSIIVIAGCSGFAIFFSMVLGVWISAYLKPAYAQMTGAVILIGIGFWAIYNLSRNRQANHFEAKETSRSHQKEREGENDQVLTFEIKMLGLVVQILSTPTVADFDRSGSISTGEAVLLGLALSLDAFGAGIGAAFIGLSPWLTALVTAVMSSLFILGGLRIGFRYADSKWLKKLSFLPGLILILVGIIKFF